LTQCALRSRFDKARTLAKVDFQFRDIRAKAATDTGDLAHSQKLLTLHAPDSTRLIGFDNALGGVKPQGSHYKHAGIRYPYDHRHRHATDVGVLYEFDTAYQLVSDFYAEVDRVLKEVSA
jgi:hypothetical protein